MAYWARTGGWGAPDPRTVLAPLSGVVEFLRDGETIALGITVHATPGHTPGTWRSPWPIRTVRRPNAC
ncbi:hypothetical protein DEH69_17330 [Streptomyces sp. PT12]|nr:hypothetical protein DEH69_17330 [Streptomyces sp. PT12]